MTRWGWGVWREDDVKKKKEKEDYEDNASNGGENKDEYKCIVIVVGLEIVG
jgi:hypothetical protein